MEIDINSAVPVGSSGASVPEYSNKIDLSTAVPKDADFSMHMSSDRLTKAFSAMKIWKVKSKPDPVGQAVSGAFQWAIDSTVNFAANMGDMIADMNDAVVEKRASQARIKRLNPNYNPMLDPNSFNDMIAISVSDRNKGFAKTTVFDKVTEATGKFMRNNFPQKPGAINEWTYKLVNAGLSIPQSFGLMRMATALKAGRLAQAMTPAFVIGAQQAGGVSEEAEAKGKPMDVRLDAFTQDLLVQGGIEAVGMDFLKNGLKGVKLGERVAIDGLNNMGQEVLQSLSEDGIRIINGLSYESAGQIFRKAADAGVIGAVIGTASSAVSNVIENKSIVGDFRKVGMSDIDIDMAINEIMGNDYAEDGQLEAALKQKGMDAEAAAGAERVIRDLGVRELRKTVVGDLVNDFKKRGMKSGDALIMAESVIRMSTERVPDEINKALKEMIDNQGHLDEFEKVYFDTLQKSIAAGRPQNMDETSWANSVIQTAKINANIAVAEAKKRGMKATDVWKSMEIEIKKGNTETAGAYRQEFMSNFEPSSAEIELAKAGTEFMRTVSSPAEYSTGSAAGFFGTDGKYYDLGRFASHDKMAEAMGFEDMKAALSSGLVRVHTVSRVMNYEVKANNTAGYDLINEDIKAAIGSGKVRRVYVDLIGSTGNRRSIDFTQEEFVSADEKIQNIIKGADAKLFQGGADSADEDSLVVMHNLSEDKLIHAEKMGGLAVPSMAIGKTKHPLEGFGEITLVGSKDMIDPRKQTNKVFNADIYSPRYPSVKYSFSSKALKASRASVAQEEKDLGRNLGSDLDSGSFERKGMEALYDSAVLRLRYLRSIGKDVVIPKKAPKLENLSLNPWIERFVSTWNPPSDLYQNKEFLAEFEKTRLAAMEKAKNDSLAAGNTMEDAEEISKMYGEAWYEEDGTPNYNIIRNMMNEVDEKRTAGTPDYYAAEREISDAVRGDMKRFHEWVDKNYSDIIGKEQLYNGEDRRGNVRYLPHTLQNVARVMKRELQSGEGFNYGLGNVRASVAKRYRSIREIQDDRNKLMSKEQFDEAKQFADEQFEDILSEAYEKYEHKGGIGVGDTFTTVLIDGIKHGNIEKELKEYGFGSMDMDRIKALLDLVRHMPTEYFEAKVQRPVMLREFSGAIVPRETSDRAIRVLERNEIPYVKYDQRVPGDRARALRQVSESSGVLFQSDLGFYSKAEKVILEKVPNNVDAGQLLNTLKNNGVKPEEIEVLGLDTLSGKISKADLLTLIKANQVPLEEKVLGSEFKKGDFADLGNGKKFEVIDPMEGTNSMVVKSSEGVPMEVDKRQFTQSTKFSQYQLPGGENYREVLIKLPVERQTSFEDFLAKYRSRFPKSELTDAEVKNDIYLGSSATIPEHGVLTGKQEKGVFKSSHFDDPNILVHARINDRMVDGKKVLFIEEIQSDWHQKGRKEGYVGDRDTTGWTAVESKREKGLYEVRKQDGELMGQFSGKSSEEAIKRAAEKGEGHGVPSAPFKKTWHELMFKRLLDKAVKEGYDAVAWTTGEQQAERYDLSKQISRINWTKHDNGKYGLMIFDKNGSLIREAGRNNLEPSQIEDFVGKDIAKKITESTDDGGDLQGLDLKVGGEGMKGFYDQMLPSFVNKYTKKWGGKVGEIDINSSDVFSKKRLPSSEYEVFDSKGQSRGVFYSAKEANSFINELTKGKGVSPKEPVHFLDITPAMRESIQNEGQPLFQGHVNPRAQFDPNGKNGKKIITLFRTADQTSLTHELLHGWIENMQAYVNSGDADAEYMQHWDTMKTWLGIQEGQEKLTREQQEKAATGWEQFLREGNAPIGTNLQAAFAAFRTWMIKIYTDPSVLGQPISQDVRDFFSRMIGGTRAMTPDEMVSESEDFHSAFVDLARSLADDDRREIEYRISANEDELKDIKELRDYLYTPNKFKQPDGSIKIVRRGKIAESEFRRGEWQDTRSKVGMFFDDNGTSLDLLADEWYGAENGTAHPRQHEDEMSAGDEFRQLIISTFVDRAGYPSVLIEENRVLREMLRASNSKGRSAEDYGDVSEDEIMSWAKKNAERIVGENLVPGTKPLAVSEKFKITMKQWMRDREKAAKTGFKAGEASAKEKFDKIVDQLRWQIKDISRVKKEVAAYGAAMLPKSYGRRVASLMNASKDQDGLIKAFIRINEMRDAHLRDVAINELRDMIGKLADNDSIDIGYKQKALDLMDDVELKGHSKETMDRIQAMKKAVDAGAYANTDMAKEIDILSKVNIKDLTLSQIQGYKEKLSVLLELARTKIRVRKEARKLRKDVILSRLAQGTSAMTIAKEHIVYGRELTADERFANLMAKVSNIGSRISMAVTPIDVIMDTLDGGNGSFSGINYTTFKATLDGAFGRYLNRKDAYQLPIIALSQELGLNQQNFERIGIFAVKQQEGGMQKLRATLSPEQLVEMESMTLTEPEMKWYLAARKMLDAMRSPIESVMYSEYNKSVDKVKNYFPFMTDWSALNEAEIQDRIGQFAEGTIEKAHTASKRNPNKNMTISRVGGDQKVNLNAFDVFMKHSDDVAYLVEMAADLRLLGEIAADERYKNIAGDRGQAFIKSWIDLLARKGGTTEANKIAALDAIRRNIGAGTLGFKLTSMLIQPTSLADAAGRVGGDWIARGISHINDPKWVKLIMQMPEIRRRAGDDPAYADFISGLNGGEFIWLRKVQEAGMKPLQYLDMLSAMATAAGAYEKHMAALGEDIDFGSINKVAMERAQLDVRRTQSSGFFKDAPMISTRGALTGNVSLDKFIAQFNNFVMNRFSTIHEIKAELRSANIQALTNRVMFFLIAALSTLGVRAGIGALKDLVMDDGKDYDFESGLWNELLGNIPIVGNTIASLITGKDASIPIPGVSAVGDVFEQGNRLARGKKLSTKAKAAVRLVGTAGRIAGLPTMEVQDIATRAIGGTSKKSSKKLFRRSLKRRKMNRKSL